MQIFKADESGVSIVHKPRKVVVELDQQNVCVAKLTQFSHVHLHLFMPCLLWWFIHVKKQYQTIRSKEQYIPNTLFKCSETGWIYIFTLSGSSFSFKTYSQSDQFCFSRIGIHLTFPLN